jgi:hypothetical protein
LRRHAPKNPYSILCLLAVGRSIEIARTWRPAWARAVTTTWGSDLTSRRPQRPRDQAAHVEEAQAALILHVGLGRRVDHRVDTCRDQLWSFGFAGGAREGTYRRQVPLVGTPLIQEATMPVRFIGIDPTTDGDECPSVSVDPTTGDFLFHGWTVTDPETLKQIAEHSPIADDESVVRLPARMRGLILEALEVHLAQAGPDVR